MRVFLKNGYLSQPLFILQHPHSVSFVYFEHNLSIMHCTIKHIAKQQVVLEPGREGVLAKLEPEEKRKLLIAGKCHNNDYNSRAVQLGGLMIKKMHCWNMQLVKEKMGPYVVKSFELAECGGLIEMVSAAIISHQAVCPAHEVTAVSPKTVVGRKHGASWTRRQFVAGPTQKGRHGVAATRTPTVPSCKWTASYTNHYNYGRKAHLPYLRQIQLHPLAKQN